MNQEIANINHMANDCDEALAFYTQKLGFDLIADTRLNGKKRWVLEAPKGESSCNLLLAQADGNEQSKIIGIQTEGRVFLFLNTDDFWHDYKNMMAVRVQFKEEPREEAYGTVAVFEDLYGNLWDLIQPI